MVAPTPAAHPVLGALAAMDGALTDIAGVNPVFMDARTKRLALEGIAVEKARLAELELRILGTADDVADTSAAADLGTWLVAHTHEDLGTARAGVRLAQALDRRYDLVRAGMADGVVSAAQARVICEALDGLPGDVPPETVTKAEEFLVDHAQRHCPRELRAMGRRILLLVADEDDDAEAALARQLEAEEADARRRTKLTMKALGDGTTRITAVVPDATAFRLKTYLDAFTSPRQGDKHVDPFTEGTHPRRLGQAFCALLEHVDPKRLPEHGGDATTVTVTISLDSLRKELGVGELVGSGPMSASEIRRLACTAHIIPAVLGGRGELLDLGRSRRLFTKAQRRALALLYGTCQAEGCHLPGSWAEAHHWISWAAGGATDLANAVLLCSTHHRRVHDARFTADRLPNGDVRFTRRR